MITMKYKLFLKIKCHWYNKLIQYNILLIFTSLIDTNSTFNQIIWRKLLAQQIKKIKLRIRTWSNL